MDAKLIAVLLSWAVNLSNYTHPGEIPELIYKSPQFFVNNACNGNEKCEAVAGYDDQGVIYIDERLKGHTDANTRSVVVHELVHYLQDLSGRYNDMDCELYSKREREAYSVQRQYLNKIAGRFTVMFMNYPPCHG